MKKMVISGENPINDLDRIAKAKEHLQIAMDHQLLILREILSSLKQEYQALMEENFFVLHGVREHRSPLFISFERWECVFSEAIEQIGNKKVLSKSFVSFAEKLNYMKELISPDDIELHLSQEQLSSILGDIQDQSTTILHFLENQSIPPDLIINLAPDEKSKAFHIAIGVMDPEDESSNPPDNQNP